MSAYTLPDTIERMDFQMFVSMKAILDDANERGYGVMAMNSINMEMVRAGIMAAEEEHSPIIIQFGNGQMNNHAHLEEMVPMIRELAERVHVPVALNFDHGADFYAITNCINAGFTNVMFDGSALDYEENVKRTAMICALAHAKGCSVEGELGHVGQAADADDDKIDLYTNPEQALDFVKRTHVDALAVAIGTVVLCQEKVQIKSAFFTLSYPAKTSAFSFNAA